MMPVCDVCGREPPLCDRCVDDALATQAGHAAARGYAWGQRVARMLGATRRRWPTWDASERVRQLARAKVADLALDERVLDRLARCCAAEAERAYTRAP